MPVPALLGFFWLYAFLALHSALSLGAAVSLLLEDLPDYNFDAYLAAEPTRYDSRATTLQTLSAVCRSVTWIDLFMLFRAPLIHGRMFYSHTAVLDPWGIVRASVGSFFGGAKVLPQLRSSLL